MRLISILLTLCASVSWALAQEDPVVVLTPERLFEVVDSRSSAVRLASLVTDEAREGVSAARSNRLPDVKASWEVGYLGNGYLTDRNFSSGMVVYNPHFVNNLAIEAMQTIYSGGGVTQGIRLAELRSRMADLSLEESRQQVRFVMISALIDLNCLYRQRDVIDQNIQLANQVLDQMRLRHEQGLILENDLTRYELLIADLQLQRDRIAEAANVANSHIATTLSYPEGTRFALSDDVIDEYYPLPALENWKEMASKGNFAVNKARLGIEIGKSRLKIAKSEMLPHVGAFIYGHFDSPITIEVPVIDRNFMYWGMGINVSYNISSLFKSNKRVAQARTAVLENETQLLLADQSVTDRLTEGYEAFLTARSALKTQRYAQRLADQNYDVVSSRFAEGMALVTDLVDAANVKIASRTGVENALTRLSYCLYMLKYISNTL